jgi:hypothetical protein
MIIEDTEVPHEDVVVKVFPKLAIQTKSRNQPMQAASQTVALERDIKSPLIEVGQLF